MMMSLTRIVTCSLVLVVLVGLSSSFPAQPPPPRKCHDVFQKIAHCYEILWAKLANESIAINSPAVCQPMGECFMCVVNVSRGCEAVAGGVRAASIQGMVNLYNSPNNPSDCHFRVPTDYDNPIIFDDSNGK